MQHFPVKANSHHLTIGRLAREANVGVETIRYYQKLALLPAAAIKIGAFNHYPVVLIGRVRFIKRSQSLGFTLAEIASLLRLEDAHDKSGIRNVTNHHLQDIKMKIADLQRMQKTLLKLVHECESSEQAEPCPIITSLSDHHTNASPACTQSINNPTKT
ncbi:MAG: MerR family DNA-binding protein [Methylotenera sp.]|nr:MerR family DNA-binding protein [Methylotenera sp.]